MSFVIPSIRAAFPVLLLFMPLSTSLITIIGILFSSFSGACSFFHLLIHLYIIINRTYFCSP